MVHYIGAVLPQSVTVKDVLTVGDLRKDGVAEQFTSSSTLYVPPREPSNISPSAVRDLNLADAFHANREKTSAYPLPKWASAKFVTPPAYGVVELAAVSQLECYVIPPGQRLRNTSTVMKKLMIDLALSPSLQRSLKSDPEGVLCGVSGLSIAEHAAISSGQSTSIFDVMQTELVAATADNANTPLSHIDTTTSVTIPREARRPVIPDPRRA